MGHVFYICVDDADFCTRVKQPRLPLRLRAPGRALPHGGLHDRGLQPGRNFQFGSSGAIYVRRYAKPWQWLTYARLHRRGLLVA